MNDPIEIWDWDSAPQVYRNLSQHGGDEDWVMIVPEDEDVRFYDGHPLIRAIGVCDTSRHQVKERGVVVYIGAHA